MSSVFNSQNIERMRVNGNEIALAKINGNVVFQKKKLIKTFFGDSKQDTTSGKNLNHFLDENNDLLNNGFNYQKNGEKISISGTANKNWDYKLSDNITFKAGKNYTMSYVGDIDNLTLYLLLGSQNGGQKSINKNIKSVTFLINEDVSTSIKFSASTGFNTNVLNLGIQIEEGTVATEYEPYTGGKPSPSPDYPQKISSINGVNLKISNGSKELKIPINLQGNILAKVGDYADELQVYSNGDIKILKKTGNFILKGNENWIESSRTSLTNYVSTLDLETINEKIKYNTSSFCKVNYFSRVDISSLSNEIGFELYTEVNSSYKYLGISMDINKIKNIQDFKEWLSTNNTKFLYQLSELESSIKIQNIKEELNSFGDFSNIEIETTYS